MLTWLKRVALATLIVLAFAAPAAAQWQVANHALPLGKGSGLGFNAIGAAANTKLLSGQGTSSDPAFVTISGDCTIANGALTCLKTNGTNFATIATSGSASDLASGTVPNARLDAEVQCIAGLTSAADSFPYFTGSGTCALYSIVSQTRAFLTDVGGLSLAQGDLTYYNGSHWVVLAPGTSGGVLETLGAGANPAWLQSDTAATASTLALRSANANLRANEFTAGFATTATAGGTTTLTVGSAQIQQFTGTSNQTVALPDVTTLNLGHRFEVINNSSGTVTVQSSGGNTVLAVGSGNTGFFFVVATTGTTAASWTTTYVSSGAGTGTVTQVICGTGLSGGTITTTGTCSLTTPVAVANGGTGNATNGYSPGWVYQSFLGGL